jgi:hypothetical protein
MTRAVARETEGTEPTLVVNASPDKYQWITFEKPGRPDKLRVFCTDNGANVTYEKYVRLGALPAPLQNLVNSYLEGVVPQKAIESLLSYAAGGTKHPRFRDGVGAGIPCPGCNRLVGTVDISGALIFHAVTCVDNVDQVSA